MQNATQAHARALLRLVDCDLKFFLPQHEVSFDDTRLRENMLAFFEAIMRAKPAAAKGTYVKGITVSSTMGPGIKLDPSYLQAAIR